MATEQDIKVSTAISSALPADEVHVLLTVTTPEGSQRLPTDICCVIDVSGSMGAEAVIQSASGGPEESNGLTMLDIAKHGVKTVITTLGPNDRFALVWFNHASKLVLPLTVMNEAGQKSAIEAVESLSEGGGTNIWEGLLEGLKALEGDTGGDQKRLGHMMLLTDGQTTNRESTVPNLQQHRCDKERLPGTISTFGFGYGIDSELLVMLAAEGEGTYSFIPDAGFVGTVFVNTMSNLLVTMARESYLTVAPEEGAELLEVRGGLTSTTSGESTRVSFGTMQYGQSRDVVLRMKIPATAAGDEFLSASLRYETATGVKESDLIVASAEKSELSAAKVEPHVHRALFVETLAAAFGAVKVGGKDDGRRSEAHAAMLAAADKVAKSSSADQEFVKALLEDMTGQSSLALSKEEYCAKWGRHYLPSIMFAHKVQQCNNFKDPSVQLYGNALFKDIQDKADELFNTLPAPKPRVRTSSRPSSAMAAPSAPVSMASYNDRYGVCIDAASPAILETGELRPVGQLRKGDRVQVCDGAAAEVLCLVRTRCPTGTASLVRLPGGAQVTPYHPVDHEGSWRFPADLAEPQECICEAVCSLVLKGAPALLVGDTRCVALGHGLEEGAARHPYFGSSAVLEDLQGAPGYASGLVEIQPWHVVRDVETGLVSAFNFKSE